MKASEFDKMFDDGEDISHLVDWKNARRPALEARRVNVDFPDWMVKALDREANRIGVTRQSLIKLWLADRLELAGKR
ncbi:MAG: hypothetical protein WDN08_02965 [Rhizomicrobium sp.]